jgi:hypothetical protein
MVWSIDYDVLHKPLLSAVVDNMSNMRPPWIESKELPERAKLAKRITNSIREHKDALTVSFLFHPRLMLSMS